MVKERAIVFIDGNNLYKGLRECYGIDRLDLLPFSKHIVQDRELKAIYYADANFIREFGATNYDSQQTYFSEIRKIRGLVFRKGYFNKRTRPPTEKLADVHLATDMVDLCHRDEFDIAYLVSGDSDLAPATDIIVRQGKAIINVYFDMGCGCRNSYGLRGHCSSFKNLTRSLAETYKWIPPIPPEEPIKEKPESCDSGDPLSK